MPAVAGLLVTMPRRRPRPVHRPMPVHIKYVGIQKATLVRYRYAVAKFFQFLVYFDLAMPRSLAHLDFGR